MYDDLILSQRPICYVATSEASFGGDKSDNIPFSYAIGDMDYFGLTPRNWILANRVVIPNDMEIASSTRQRRKFTLDFWALPEKYAASASTTELITTSDSKMRVYSDYDRIIFEVIDADGNVYRAFRTVANIEGILHITCVFTGSIILVVVNSMAGDSVLIPETFRWGSVNAEVYAEPGIANLAIFNRASSADEILARYEAGTTAQDFAEVCEADGADYWDFSRRWKVPAAQVVIDSEDWRAGIGTNVVVDKENSISLNYHEDLVSYLSGVEAAPSFSAGRLVLGTTRCASRSALGALSNSQGVLTVNVSLTTPSTTKTIATFYDARGGVQWKWYVNSSMALRLDKTTITASGSESTTTYNYDNSVSASFDFVIVMRADTIEVSSGSNVTNPVSGQATISESISINDSTKVIFGGDRELAGPGVDSINNIKFFNYIPAYSDFTNLLAWPTPTTTYIGSNDDLEAVTYGVWDYQFSFPYDGLFAGHAIDWAGSAATGSIRGEIGISSDGSSYTQIEQRESKFSVLPDTGDMGNTTDAGPYYIKLELYGKGQNVGFFNSIVITLFTDAEIKSVNTDKVATIIGTNHTSSMHTKQPYQGQLNGNMRLIGSAATRVQFPSDTFRTVELVCRAPGQAQAGSILSFNDGTTREILFATNGDISSTGFLEFYVNNNLVTTTYQTLPGDHLHMVGILAADATATVSVGRKYDGTGNTPNDLAVYGYSSYNYAMNGQTVFEHFGASVGLIQAIDDFTNEVALVDTVPYAYVLAWETTGATT